MKFIEECVTCPEKLKTVYEWIKHGFVSTSLNLEVETH